MSLVSLLATTTLITLANSAPMIYAAEHRAKIPLDHDHLLLILLLNRKDYGAKTKPMDETLGGDYSIAPIDSPGGPDTNDLDLELPNPGPNRDKRIGSLSVVNSVDVLRERVLLELARRKAMEDQGMFGKNRNVVSSIGKRSRGFAYRDQKRLRYDGITP